MDERYPEPGVSKQIGEMNLDPERPLIITDADEVLVRFLAGLENYLLRNGLWLDLKSFALTGNIKRQTTDEPLPHDAVRALIRKFFEEETAELTPVPGAAETLRTLSRHSQIIVLTNVPHTQRERRRNSLAHHGMDYPVIANSGLKGPAVRQLAARTKGAVFFIDDLPQHIQTAAQSAPHSWRIHLVTDDRLAQFVEPSPHSHLNARHWEEVRLFIEAIITGEPGGTQQPESGSGASSSSSPSSRKVP